MNFTSCSKNFSLFLKQQFVVFNLPEQLIRGTDYKPFYFFIDLRF